MVKDVRSRVQVNNCLWDISIFSWNGIQTHGGYLHGFIKMYFRNTYILQTIAVELIFSVYLGRHKG